MQTRLLTLHLAIFASGPLLSILTGCTLPPTRREFEQKSPGEQFLSSIVSLDVLIRVGGTDFLNGVSVIFSRGDKPVPYKAPEPGAEQAKPGGIHVLESAYGDEPAIRYEVIERPGGETTVLRFYSDAPLPDFYIAGQVSSGLRIVRLKQHGEHETVFSLLGSGLFAAGDALYDVSRDRAVGIDALFAYSSCIDEPAALTILVRSKQAREASVTFQNYPDVMKARFGLAPASRPADEVPQPPAPECCVLESSSAERAALEPWLNANLAAFVQCSRRPAKAGVPNMLCATRPAADTSATLPPVWRGWKKKLDKTKDIYRRITERGQNYNWQHARELMATTLDDYWCHGVVRTNVLGPLLIGPPLSLEHARMWASLMGLSGQGVVIGDDPSKLPAERVELLRAITPPAPISAVDLFAHQLPDQWVLTTDATWLVAPNETSIVQSLMVGLFNWSLEPQTAHVRFTDLLPVLVAYPEAAGASFAVWDFWNRKLLAVSKGSFSLPMPPASSRVLVVVPLSEDRPMLISAGRHITQGALELTRLQWDAKQSIMSGVVALAANDPYELRIFVPEGNKSFEIEQAHSDDAAVEVRRDGPIRLVTLTSAADMRTNWVIHFRPAPLHLPPPAAPAGLSAIQNTRGVLLTWQARDERAVLYRVYRDGKPLAESAEPEYQDSSAEYDRQYSYALTALDYAGRESPPCVALTHRTPIPASANLTDLVPLMAEQQHLAVAFDASAAGNPLRAAGKRYHRGLGTHANARVRYFLGGGYENFTGEVGIDDETEGKGSAVFKIVADGQTLFTSPLLRGGSPPMPFSVPVRDRMALELIVTDGGDNPDNDHADWGNPYLQARVR